MGSPKAGEVEGSCKDNGSERSTAGSRKAGEEGSRRNGGTGVELANDAAILIHVPTYIRFHPNSFRNPACELIPFTDIVSLFYHTLSVMPFDYKFLPIMEKTRWRSFDFCLFASFRDHNDLAVFTMRAINCLSTSSN
jgi:hypothetical protein